MEEIVLDVYNAHSGRLIMPWAVIPLDRSVRNVCSFLLLLFIYYYCYYLK
jgi:hypothetical protein